MSENAPDPLDQLYASPLADFVKTRDRLAGDLRKRGDKSRAAEIKALSKPTPAAWAVNQVARSSPEELRRLLETSDRMARLQLRAGADADSRRRFDETSGEHRRILAELLALAERALKDGGHAAAPAMLERVANNLRWGALDDDTRPLLAGGRLFQDLAPQGFGAFAPAAPDGDDGAVDLARSRPPIVQAAPSPLSRGKKESAAPPSRPAASHARATEEEEAKTPLDARQKAKAGWVDVSARRALLRDLEKRVTRARRELERRAETARSTQTALAELERRTEQAREVASAAEGERSQAEALLAEEEAQQQAAADALEAALRPDAGPGDAATPSRGKRGG